MLVCTAAAAGGQTAQRSNLNGRLSTYGTQSVICSQCTESMKLETNRERLRTCHDSLLHVIFLQNNIAHTNAAQSHGSTTLFILSVIQNKHSRIHAATLYLEQELFRVEIQIILESQLRAL